MSRIRSRDTGPERVLRKALWSLGLHYRVCGNVLGKPDIMFPSCKVAVFIDGCFWHGCPLHRVWPKTRKILWKSKIQGNIKRDRRVDAELQKQGWAVLRFWEHEVERNLFRISKQVAKTVRQKRTMSGTPW